MIQTVAAPKVAYVLGVYRSGTTLLSNLIGQLDGFFCVGELRAIWRELGLESARCGCGVPLTACETWRQILGAAYGGMAEAQELAPRMLLWQGKALRRRHRWLQVPAILRRHELDSVESPLRQYAEGLLRLYRAIREVTGARVIVDSSKEPSDAALIRLLPDVSMYMIQIVRDPRGNVFSSKRAMSANRGKPTDWRWSAYATLGWMAGNVAASAVRRAHGTERSLLLRYEDLIDMPNLTLERIVGFVGDSATGPLVGDGQIVMAPTHSVAGNPNRFRTGPVELIQDVAWHTSLTPFERRMVTAICAPLMMRYRYPLMP